MIQLTFQAAFDPLHAMFRILRLRSTFVDKPLHKDHVRILDFYLLFPFRISGIRLAPEHRGFRRLAKEYESTKPYGEQPEDKIMFDRMEPMQVAALETLAVRDYIDAEYLERSQVRPTAIPLPTAVTSRIEEANARDSRLLEFLKILASDYSLTGSNGLKHRTHLAEYRYDAV